MVLTSYLSRICLLTSLFGMTAPHSAGAVSLAFRPAESSMSWSIANKTDTGKENVSAQLSIARTVRDMAQEYGYEADRSRSEVITWMYVTSVAWIAVLVMRLCYPTAYTSVELMFASAQLRAKQAGAAARHSARSPHPRADVAGTTNDFLTRVATDSWGGTQPAEQRRAVALEPTWLCPQLIVQAGYMLRCTLPGTHPGEGHQEAVLVRSSTDGTPLFQARVQIGNSEAAIVLETVRGEERLGSLSAKETHGEEPEMEIARACGAKFGSVRRAEAGGHVIAGRTGAPVLLLGGEAQAHDLYVHESGGHDLDVRDLHAHDFKVRDPGGTTLAEVRPGSDEDTYEVKIYSNGDAGLIVLGLLAIHRKEWIVPAITELAQ
mmetsp:Transcript_72385/g.205162  ORF Transcript_72385/g.205162 Transcript_72385/m.205162 type:complete len:377 (+) Transcript_72385:45-1175(+)